MRSRARSTSNLAGPWLTSSAVLLVFSIALVALLPADPGFFHRLGAEDGPIEWLSALLLFLACGFALLCCGAFSTRARLIAVNTG